MNADVVIIGGSLAGAACARELSRWGVEAVVVEREPFPREKVCGGFLSPGAVQTLDEIGMLAGVRSAGAVPVRATRIRMREAMFTVELPGEGLGISRKTLDAALAEGLPILRSAVQSVVPRGNGFRVTTGQGAVDARVVVDAAGKHSRLTRRTPAPFFGVQFYVPETRNDVLDFWFFADGYGGAVSIEGGRSNACFLINKDALPRYRSRPDCRVTGPLAYERRSSDWLAIGDAAGMVDPFCGEGMRHALDTGRLAADAISEGLSRNWSYERMRAEYDAQRTRRWRGKRLLSAVIRRALRYPPLAQRGFAWSPERFLRRLWA